MLKHNSDTFHFLVRARGLTVSPPPLDLPPPASRLPPPSLPASQPTSHRPASQPVSPHVGPSRLTAPLSTVIFPTNFRGPSTSPHSPHSLPSPKSQPQLSLSLSLLEIETHLDFPCGVRPQHAGFLGPSAHVRRRGARPANAALRIVNNVPERGGSLRQRGCRRSPASSKSTYPNGEGGHRSVLIVLPSRVCMPGFVEMQSAVDAPGHSSHCGEETPAQG